MKKNYLLKLDFPKYIQIIAFVPLQFLFLTFFKARHVITVSSHKYEASISSYARTEDQQKHKIALRTAESITGLYLNLICIFSCCSLKNK